MSAKNKTAAELMADLGAVPEFSAQQAERKLQRLRDFEALRVASAPILAELEREGFKVSSIGELAQSGVSYENVVPALVRWLPMVANPQLKEALVRALSVPHAKPGAAPVLVAEFQNASRDQVALKWAIGSALEVVADDSVFAQVVALVRDRTHGRAREMLALALGNMSDARAVDVLLDLLNDGEVAGHAIMGLGKLGASRAREPVAHFLSDPRAWVRREAKRAIGRIDKSQRNLSV